MSRETYNYKRAAIKAAKELCYPVEIITQLQKATQDSDISRIMRNARQTER
jgi:hypothetical protein